MNEAESYGIVFTEGFGHRYNDRILHILCTRGNIGFTFRRTRYNISKGDYAIITEVPLSSDFSMSPDFDGFIMWLSHDFIDAASIRSNYGVFGKLSLMREPVMRLSDKERARCADDMARLKERLCEKHLFRDEMLGSLLAAHILDLYDIHSRLDNIDEISERAAKLMNDFINLLQRGEYLKSRELGHYASLLCITPHYLSDISRELSGKPAGYWIDRFAIADIVKAVADKRITLTEISEKFNFRSLSHFSRYFSAKVGTTPSQYRHSQ